MKNTADIQDAFAKYNLTDVNIGLVNKKQDLVLPRTNV